MKKVMQYTNNPILRERYRGCLIFSVLFFFFVMFSGAGEPGAQGAPEDTASVRSNTHPGFSLADLYTIALERSEKIKISEEDLFISEKDRERALAALLPTLSAFGNYTRYSEEKTSSVSFGNFPVQPEWSASWGLRLDKTLSLSGREITAYNISKMGIETSRYDMYTVMEDYLLSVSEAYYDVLKVNKAVEIAAANVGRLTKHRDAAQTRFRVGEVTKTAVLRAGAELSGAQAKQVEAQNLLSLAKAALARVVGIEGDFTLRETACKRQEISDLGLLQQEALAGRAEIKAGTIKKQIARNDVLYAKGAYWPTLSLEGVYERRDESPSSPFFLDDSIYGVLRINFPFYEGGLRKAEVKQAEARHRQAELLYEDMKKTVAIEVENAYLDLKTQEGILESLRDQVAFAGENYNTVSKQFEYGLANSIDVMDANTLLVEAETDFFRAQYDYQVSIIRLQRATGKLLETAIGH